MIVITAPEKYVSQSGDVCVFLAGGITNCTNWQKEVIQTLRNKMKAIDEAERRLVVFNPRRDYYPVHDPSANQEQIEWEFKYLERCHIFSMYFCSGESDQPICMYELGRHLRRIATERNRTFVDCAIVTVEDGYKRHTDVLTQGRLASNGELAIATGSDATPSEHARRIVAAYKRLADKERIFGEDTGNLDPDEIAKMSDWELFMDYYSITKIQWRLDHDSCRDFSRKRLPEKDYDDIQEQVRKLQYPVEYLLYVISKRNDIEVNEPAPGKHIRPDRKAFMTWYKFYDDHFMHTLTNEQWDEFERRREAGEDVSEFLPKGNWRDILQDA